MNPFMSIIALASHSPMVLLRAVCESRSIRTVGMSAQSHNRRYFIFILLQSLSYPQQQMRHGTGASMQSSCPSEMAAKTRGQQYYMGARAVFSPMTHSLIMCLFSLQPMRMILYSRIAQWMRRVSSSMGWQWSVFVRMRIVQVETWRRYHCNCNCFYSLKSFDLEKQNFFELRRYLLAKSKNICQQTHKYLSLSKRGCIDSLFTLQAKQLGPIVVILPQMTDGVLAITFTISERVQGRKWSVRKMTNLSLISIPDETPLESDVSKTNAYLLLSKTEKTMGFMILGGVPLVELDGRGALLTWTRTQDRIKLTISRMKLPLVCQLALTVWYLPSRESYSTKQHSKERGGCSGETTSGFQRSSAGMER